MEKKKETDRSIHICYEHQERYRLHLSYLRLLDYAVEKSGKNRAQFQVLDLGCGRGDFLELIGGSYRATGLDFDEKCVQIARRFAEVKLGNIEDVNIMFQNEQFDMVVMSHVLEHMKNPTDVIQKVKSLGPDWLLIGVPNPARLKVLMKYNLFSTDYSNKGHYYSWDRSHFSNFLERHCGLEIIKWEVDEVYAVPLRPLRKVFKAIRVLDFSEMVALPKLFPYFSSSLIVLCKTISQKTG